MRGLRRGAVRLSLAAGVLVLLAVEAQELAVGMSTQARLREKALRDERRALDLVRTRLGDLQGSAVPQDLVREAARLTGAAEAELYEMPARDLLAQTRPVPAAHWPSEEELRRLYDREVLAFGPFPGRSPRILAYALVGGASRPYLLRVATAPPELASQGRDRSNLLLVRGLAVALLLLGGGLSLLGERGEGPEARPSALEAYEAAMARLRERGEALSAQHDAERRRLEEVLQDREAMARAGELTAGMVHEVRNGLGTILGHARLLERGEGEAAREAGQGIREECETLETVVRRFMEFVKRESLAPAHFDLARMLGRVVARESRRHPDVQVHLGGWPERPAYGDEALLERAFENLVRNALEASRVGQVWIRAEGADDGAVVVSIADDGPGLPAPVREQIRPFLTTKAGGLGLGLATSLKIVKLHGGGIAFADRAPQGLEVLVRLPPGPPAA